MIIVVLAFGTAIIYFTFKERLANGFRLVKIMMAMLMSVTLYGAGIVFINLVRFDFGDDINFLIRGLFYVTPLVFILSGVVIFLGLFSKS